MNDVEPFVLIIHTSGPYTPIFIGYASKVFVMLTTNLT